MKAARRNCRIRRNKKARIPRKSFNLEDSDKDYEIDEEDLDISQGSSGYSVVVSDESIDLDVITSCTSGEKSRGCKSKPRKDFIEGSKATVRSSYGKARASMVPHFFDDTSCRYADNSRTVRLKSKKRISFRQKIKRRSLNRKTRVYKASDEDEASYDSEDIDFIPDGEGDDYDEEEGPCFFQRRACCRGGMAQKRRRRYLKGRMTEAQNKNLRPRERYTLGKISGKKVNKKNGRTRKRRSPATDSDFVVSGTSDFDISSSEDIWESARETSGSDDLTTCLRSSPSSKRLTIGRASRDHYKSNLTRKGKEKMETPKAEFGKQVCGICLSEERASTVRGILNCCSHHFCFTCITEWSKAETRCPMCKQRFVTIAKEARADSGVILRSVVIKVPRRDQVYQPSEEEIINFLNPYENMFCTECQQGGDDELMLLCDICDSSAHTYCVGLGREVPEGNWYCDACRSCSFGSSHCPASTSPPHHVSSSNPLQPEASSWGRGSGGFDANTLADPGLWRGSGQTVLGAGDTITSPQAFVRDTPANSPSVPGPGASTVSQRRRLRFRIHDMLSTNRRRQNPEMRDHNSTDVPPSSTSTTSKDT